MNPTEPDPAFVDRLEWQVRTALRRRERFARPTSTAVAPVVRTAALCLVCLFGGAGAVLAAGEWRQDRERALHVARARIELEMAELRLAHATAEQARVEAAGANALVDTATLEAGRVETARIARAVERERLELAETEACGRPANDDLAAPLVVGRDFVTERLELELVDLEQRRDRLAAAAARAEVLAEQSRISESERAAAADAVAAAEGRVGLALELLELRARFVGGALDARELLVREQVARVDADLRDGERELASLDLRLPRTRALAEAGRISSKELEEAEHARDLRERELELLRVERERWLERSGR